jgi:hypothetical protein
LPRRISGENFGENTCHQPPNGFKPSARNLIRPSNHFQSPLTISEKELPVFYDRNK